MNELARTISSLRGEVQSRRLREAEEHLDPNQTNWVSLIALQLQSVEHIFSRLQTGVKDVLESEPGEAVFSAQPPSSPESL